MDVFKTRVLEYTHHKERAIVLHVLLKLGLRENVVVDQIHLVTLHHHLSICLSCSSHIVRLHTHESSVHVPSGGLNFGQGEKSAQ